MIEALRGWWRKLFPPADPEALRAKVRQVKASLAAKAPRFPETHPILLDGERFKVIEVRECGLEATICSLAQHWVWCAGDFLLVRYRSGHSTRYKIMQIQRAGGMEFIECRFAPRDGARLADWTL